MPHLSILTQNAFSLLGLWVFFEDLKAGKMQREKVQKQVLINRSTLQSSWTTGKHVSSIPGTQRAPERSQQGSQVLFHSSRAAGRPQTSREKCNQQVANNQCRENRSQLYHGKHQYSDSGGEIRSMSWQWLTQSIEDYRLFCEKEFISSSENQLNWKWCRQKESGWPIGTWKKHLRRSKR